MKLIWTKSSAPLSVLIRWGLNEPVSHFAIVFDDFLVFHSNLLGVHMESLKRFSSGSAKIVYTVEIPLPLEEEERIYEGLIPQYDGQNYDYGAFCYFMWRALIWKLFNIPIPAVNRWASSASEICTEMAGTLPKQVLDKETLGDLSMVSPYKLYLKIQAGKVGL
jgi:hypothetical protein